jgi:uncharacterized protein
MGDRSKHLQDPTVIFETVHGSTAYNLAREGSDVDLKGIIVGPQRWYFGIETAPEQIDVTPDHVRYELRKFVRLGAEANPTLLEIMFVDERHHRTVTPLGALLLEHRRVFLSTSIAERFGGYALSQLKRIRTHRSHLIDPPKVAPTRAAFDLPEHTVIPADQLAAAESLLTHDDVQAADVSPNFYELLLRERRYKAALKGWQSYQQWLRSRNPQRSELEARFGYDTKHAMHLVRLQRMGLEALQTGELNVTRADRDELLAIRDGIWTFDELEAQAEAADRLLNSAKSTSCLPEKPDLVLLNNLCIQIIESELDAHR